ncbi:HlyC/CorC family transporter [Siculibacillus lacustris]|uniref:HlyC/CorC family transporter n=1 Tax=Siculibacillus lacustris TaxID=1549641 RepID=A0A4Q9VQR2_9HYPH|nr:hemolysin family protein [Siculibacillus lacustris]TBW37673.1 HlyC/CorC family transporter [Siculibacillus lacustris]
MLIVELAFFFFLTLANAFFVMSEMALVSARKPRLAALAEAGDRRARRALELGDHPGRFLSAVQIGITLTALIAGASSGAQLSERLADFVVTTWPSLARIAHEASFVVVIILMTFVTIVFAELVPKRLAIARPEAISLWVAGFVDIFSRATSPVVTLLTGTSNRILAGLGIDEDMGADVTEDEVKHVLAEGVESGALEPEEREMLEGVMRIADRPVRTVMTPRPELYWIDPADPADRILAEILACPYSALVVADGSIDEPAGLVYKKDLLPDAVAGRPLDLRAHLKQPLVVPESAPILKLLQRFRGSQVHAAFVVDEYGGLQGLVTLTDIVEGIAGDFADVDAPLISGPFRRDDGSWLIDGDEAIDILERLIDLPDLEHGGYHTVGGLMMAALNRIPTEGDKAVIGDWTFEVVDMDGRRIDKVMISPRRVPGPPAAANDAA